MRYLNQKIYSLISIIIGVVCIVITIKINNDIAQRFLPCDGKTQGLFALIEILTFHYQYYFVGLSIISLIFAIVGTKRKENLLINKNAYVIGILSLIIIFSRIWRLMI